MLERLAGHEYYCFLDGFSGYFQIPIALKDQEKTTFTCPYGTFSYKRMPFGLCNAPATFQRCITAIFHELIKDSMEVFMDDFFVFGSSFDLYLKNLEKMLKRCEETNLVLNWEKCHFMVKEGIVLCRKVSGSGFEVDKAKIESGMSHSYSSNVQIKSYEDVSLKMRPPKSFSNVIAVHQVGIMVSLQLQGKSSKPDSTGLIFSTMQEDWFELVTRANEPTTFLQGT
ncbi:reverse transcriptase domain-containing protein [Tanacetum coccineum]|uniref:Reverse transcriptase domain-containing protein n=1 Tax=Tanacetum coccineum TaxID=301880 RepID=A0ABQ5I1L5_9ASTR